MPAEGAVKVPELTS